MTYPYEIVAHDERDLGYVIGYWLDTLYRAGARELPWSLWKPPAKAMVVRVIDHGRVVVAHNPADRDHLYGFAAEADGALQYVHVRRERRGVGLGAAMVRALGCETYARVCRGDTYARKLGLRAR